MEQLDLASVFLIAISLSFDCFAVSIAVGTGITQRKVLISTILRLAFAFGIAQALMPVIGWVAGKTFVRYIENFDHWVAFVLLAFIGGKMIWEALHHEEEKANNVTRNWILFTLAIATSIDALAVGLTFAFLEVNIIWASIIIGVIAFLATVIGVLAGRKASQILGRWAEAIGGIVLIAIGLRIIITHLIEA